MLTSALGEVMESHLAGAGLTVLLAEDDQLLRDVASAGLRELGFTVLEVESGEQALAVLASDDHVDVLVTDIRMAGALDGWDLAERVRALDINMRVVYMTSGKRDATRQVAGSAFVQKPYQVAVLLETVLAVVNPA